MGRASVNQSIQIGVEITPGTPVAASKALPSLSINIMPKFESKQYRAQGYKFNTISRNHKAWSEGSVEGPVSYDEIIYPLATMFTPPSPTTPAGAVLARDWKFLPLIRGNETPKTLTVEKGDSSAAQVASHVAVTDLKFEFAADDVTLTGNAIGRAPATGSLTGSPTEIPNTIISARDLDVYIGDVLGAEGVTLIDAANKVTDAYREAFSIGKKYNPRWVHNTTYASFKDLVELPPELEADFSTEHNAQSRALYDTIVANPMKYVAFKATSDTAIEVAFPYEFEIVMAAHITAAEEEDADGVYGYKYTLAPRYDATLGSAFWIRSRNGRTAL